MREWTDKSLIAQLKSADDQEVNKAFKILFQEYYQSIKHFILSNNGTVNDAEDIFQDGLIVFYKKVRSGKLELTCSLKTYLYSICKYLWFNKIRKKKEFDLDGDEDFVLIEESQLETLIKTETGELVADLFGELGEECKSVLVLYYYEQLKMREIAQRMQLASEQVAKNKKSKCMKKLRTIVLESSFYQELLRSS